MDVRFFASQKAFRKWLERHHDSAAELYVGFYNARSGRGGLTYKQALDEALCFGWIDGVRKNLDAESYAQRFSPRKAKSYWSAINTKRYRELEKLGLVTSVGRAAFEARDPDATARYSFERDTAALTPELEQTFRAHEQAWSFWEAQPPGYRRVISWWVISAKREETRLSRLRKLIGACEKEERLM